MFEPECAALKKVLVTLLGLFGAQDIESPLLPLGKPLGQRSAFKTRWKLSKLTVRKLNLSGLQKKICN